MLLVEECFGGNNFLMVFLVCCMGYKDGVGSWKLVVVYGVLRVKGNVWDIDGVY